MTLPLLLLPFLRAILAPVSATSAASRSSASARGSGRRAAGSASSTREIASSSSERASSTCTQERRGLGQGGGEPQRVRRTKSRLRRACGPRGAARDLPISVREIEARSSERAELTCERSAGGSARISGGLGWGYAEPQRARARRRGVRLNLDLANQQRRAHKNSTPLRRSPERASSACETSAGVPTRIAEPRYSGSAEPATRGAPRGRARPRKGAPAGPRYSRRVAAV